MIYLKCLSWWQLGSFHGVGYLDAQLWIFFQRNFVDGQRGLGDQQKQKTSEGGIIDWVMGREFEHVVILIREFVPTKKAGRTFVLPALYLITRLDASLIKS